jgi:hypothetical protein
VWGPASPAVPLPVSCTSLRGRHTCTSVTIPSGSLRQPEKKAHRPVTHRYPQCGQSVVESTGKQRPGACRRTTIPVGHGTPPHQPNATATTRMLVGKPPAHFPLMSNVPATSPQGLLRPQVSKDIQLQQTYEYFLKRTTNINNQTIYI